MWRKLAIGVLVSLGAGAISAIAASDWPPWASVRRADSASLIGIAININLLWKDYCLAAGNHNPRVQLAISHDLQTWETRYEGMSGGLSLPLTPCP